MALGLAFWMRPNEWFFLDVECLAFVEMQGIELRKDVSIFSQQYESVVSYTATARTRGVVCVVAVKRSIRDYYTIRAPE